MRLKINLQICFNMCLKIKFNIYNLNILFKLFLKVIFINTNF